MSGTQNKAEQSLAATHRQRSVHRSGGRVTTVHVVLGSRMQTCRSCSTLRTMLQQSPEAENQAAEIRAPLTNRGLHKHAASRMQKYRCSTHARFTGHAATCTRCVRAESVSQRRPVRRLSHKQARGTHTQPRPSSDWRMERELPRQYFLLSSTRVEKEKSVCECLSLAVRRSGGRARRAHLNGNVRYACDCWKSNHRWWPAFPHVNAPLHPPLACLTHE